MLDGTDGRSMLSGLDTVNLIAYYYFWQTDVFDKEVMLTWGMLVSYKDLDKVVFYSHVTITNIFLLM